MSKAIPADTPPATPATPNQVKLFILRAWLPVNGTDTKDNVADLEQQITNGWSVACYEPLLQDANHGISYVLVKLEKPKT